MECYVALSFPLNHSDRASRLPGEISKETCWRLSAEQTRRTCQDIDAKYPARDPRNENFINMKYEREYY